MKPKIFILIIVVLLAVILIGALALLRGDEDTWLCGPNGWYMHGRPSSPMPSTVCGENKNAAANTNATTNTNQTPQATTSPNLKLTNLKNGDSITSPFEIQGQAKLWYFESSFPVKVVDNSGKLLTTAVATAQSDWMTENFVEFKAPLEFIVDQPTKADIILAKDNPSGLPQNDESVSISVILQPSEYQTVKVFFMSNNLDPEISCTKVFAVERRVAKTLAIARAALTELFKGPTEAEQKQGYTTTINSGVKINKIIIENGTASVDFNQTLQDQVGGSCRVGAIRAQITETLKQFPTVQNVVISIDGRTEDILQP